MDAKYNQSVHNYQNNASTSSCQEFADLFQMGHKLIKDSSVDKNYHADRDKHLQYNPPNADQIKNAVGG